MDLFDYMKEKNMEHESPLAMRMRPRTLEEVVGQQHIIGKGRLLYRAIKADRLGSVIFYGPPGTGKTTLAKVIANSTNAEFRQLNATTSGKKDMEEAVAEAKRLLGGYGRRTILFIDEIHRFNKAQQDYLLPFVEDGTVILIGATTEKPYFEVNRALLSRSTIFELKPLTREEVETLIERAMTDPDRGFGSYKAVLTEDAKSFLADVAGGDARAALNAIELAVMTTERDESGKLVIDLQTAEDCIQKRAVHYDRDGDQHYDTISAFIKSMRGSDPDAAVFYLAKMLAAGEDIRIGGCWQCRSPCFDPRFLCGTGCRESGHAGIAADSGSGSDLYCFGTEEQCLYKRDIRCFGNGPERQDDGACSSAGCPL